ncbi:4a-hydroxytetrahydrobiopterin dehydratase [filamentous cyanobacterium CCP5]|nr:4a-hydroxytetrahydrobiopterin dehydratase [filamentous cyanobacterium CCP5]
MVALEEQKCVPCEGGVDPLSDQEIQSLKPSVPDWKLITEGGDKRLKRTFKFPDFKQALEFTNQVGEVAESEGHHPVITLTWGEATVVWWTHAINGLHKNDFVMAARSDRLYGSM